MAVSAAFRDHVADLFEPFGDIKIKLMFGGAGIYFKDKMFGLIIDERIYLKTNDATRPSFDAEDCKPFTFENRKGEVISTNYIEIPSRLLDDPAELAHWARSAYEVAIAAKGSKRRTPSPNSLPRDLPLVAARRKPSAAKAKRPRR
jgi:DNA transformation protein and related proteins